MNECYFEVVTCLCRLKIGWSELQKTFLFIKYVNNIDLLFRSQAYLKVLKLKCIHNIFLIFKNILLKYTTLKMENIKNVTLQKVFSY